MADSQNVKHDHNDHIVRTKEQWDDRAIANYAIPRGVLCIELTSKTETRLKIGEGDKFYKQLPYVGGDSGDLSNYYTKQEVDNIIANLNFMSIASTRIYDSKSQLPLNGNKLGDLRFVRGEKPTDDPFEYLWNGNKWIQIGGYADIDLSKYVTREEIMPRIQSLEKSSHTHSNKSILDQITASYTIEEKQKLAELKNYDDTQIKRDISELQSKAHTHINKSILDQTTAPFTREEKTKLAELENYDDTEITSRVSDLEADAHTHTNKSILDLVEEPYTTAEKTKLASLENYTLPAASSDTLGGVKVGDGLTIDQNGVLSATGGGGQEYVAGDGINIRTETIGSEYDTSSEYYSIDETDLCYIGGSFTLTSERAALPKYAFVASHYNNNWNGPVLFSKNPEAVKYNTRGYTSNPVAFTYNNETWYRSDNGYWYQNSSISTNIKVDDLTGVVYDESDLVDYICSLLDTMHTESHAETIIENTGVLDINKNQDGDLVVSSIEGDKVIVIPSGGSGDYRAGDGIEIVEQTEPSVVEIDISDGWVNKVVTAGGSRNTIDDNKTYMRFRYPCTPGQKFKLRFTPSNATDVVYFNVFGFSSDDTYSDGQRMFPLDGDFSTDQTAEITVLDGYPSVDFTLRLNNPGWGQGSNITAASFSEMVMIVQEDVPVGEKYINVTPATTTDIGGVKVGDGLSITSDGTLSANVGVEYAAGDGISIDEGSSTTDITSLAWEQGSINPVNGEPDDFTTTVIRSPMIEVGLTNMLNVSAQATDNSDMLWKAAFYDSNSEFISMTTTWQTLSDGVTRPANAAHVIIVLRKDAETEIDENTLLACEISWPIEIGKYVITNTGVTHAELESSSVIVTENGETKTLMTFGQDLDVTNGVVSIPDYHRLVLNVEE